MRAAGRLVPTVLVVAASVAAATPAEAWSNVTYEGATTITTGYSVSPDLAGPYSSADGSTTFLRDHDDPKRSDDFVVSPSTNRFFTVTWAASPPDDDSTVPGQAMCHRVEADNVYANMISVFGNNWATEGGSAGANVRCVIDGINYVFAYANGSVQVTRSGGTWEFSSTGLAKVSKRNSKGKWVLVAENQPVNFNVSFAGSPA